MKKGKRREDMCWQAVLGIISCATPKLLCREKDGTQGSLVMFGILWSYFVDFGCYLVDFGPSS